MAEIRDVYSLEFNSGQFQSEVDSAIQRIEELNSAMADGADVADELAAAQGSLVDILGTEAKGVEQLNQKRNVLVNTQKNLNKESKSGVAVSQQLNNTNKQLAVSTGQAAVQQRGLGQTLIAGTRQISQMRRVVSTLGFAFRAIGAVLPFGLILSFAGPIISFFTSLFTATDKTAENMEKLSDSTLPLAERLEIAADELANLNAIEAKRGKLTDEEEKRRRELVKVYEETSMQIINEESKRADRMADIQFEIDRVRVRMMGDTTQAVLKNFEVERKAIIDGTNRRERELENILRISNLRRKQALGLGDQATADEQLQIYSDATDELNKLWELQTAKIEALEQERNKRLSDLADKKQKEDRKKALDAANKAIEDEENRLRLIILRTEENTLERVNAEADLIDKIQILKEKYAKELELDETEIAIMQEENLDKRKQLFDEYYKYLEEKKEKNKTAVGPTAEDLAANLKELTDGLKAQADLIENNAQRNLALQLVALEEERNQKLLQAKETITDKEKYAKEFEKIDKDYNNRRQKIEINANQLIIQDRIKFLQELLSIASAQSDKNLVADLEKQIAELQLKYTELNKSIQDSTDETAEKTTKKIKKLTDEQKELLDNTTQLIQGVSDNVFNVLNAQVDAYIEGLDKAIDKSKSALDEIRANSENYNAQQLEIEKERLEKLEAERARAVEREKALGLIQLSINSAIAISKAAAEGGAAAPFTIALTLASLIAGLAQARVAAGNAFYEGSEYVNRGNNKAGRDTIPAMLNEGERVITTDTNSRYWDVLSAVHNNKIPADVLNSFANAYQTGGLKAALNAFGENVSLSSELGDKSIFVNVAQTYSGMENRLERIEAVLTELPKYMPRTVVSANAKGIFKIVEQRQKRKNYSSNWSK